MNRSREMVLGSCFHWERNINISIVKNEMIYFYHNSEGGQVGSESGSISSE